MHNEIRGKILLLCRCYCSVENQIGNGEWSRKTSLCNTLPHPTSSFFDSNIFNKNVCYVITCIVYTLYATVCGALNGAAYKSTARKRECVSAPSKEDKWWSSSLQFLAIAVLSQSSSYRFWHPVKHQSAEFCSVVGQKTSYSKTSTEWAAFFIPANKRFRPRS